MNTTPLSRKRLAHVRTYDPNDDTAVGWDLTLYADGHVAAEIRSRWQGTRDGARWVTDPGHVSVHPEEGGDTYESRLLAIDTPLGIPDSSWRQTLPGTLVR